MSTHLVVDPDDEFIVLTREFGAQFRDVLGLQRASLEDLRAEVLRLLRTTWGADETVHTNQHGHKETVCIVGATVQRAGALTDIAIRVVKTSKVAYDGRKRVTYLTWCSVIAKNVARPGDTPTGATA